MNESFRQHAVEPISVAQADHESVLENLIVSGLGLSLLREDLARACEAAGEVAVLNSARLTTILQFIYPAAREHEPAIAALLFAVREVWNLNSKVAPGGAQPRKPRRAQKGVRPA